MSEFVLGDGQQVRATTELELLAGIEAFVASCLEIGEVFGILSVESGHYLQLYLNLDGGMNIETSIGNLADHCGFDESVPEFEYLSAGYLPAEWHSRDKIAASAFTRSLIDGAGVPFPITLGAEIHKTGQGEKHVEVLPPPPVEGARTIGFLGPNGPRGRTAAEFGAALGIETTDLKVTHNALQARIEADLGPLNRMESDGVRGSRTGPYYADVVVSLQPDNEKYVVWVTTRSGVLVVRYPPKMSGDWSGAATIGILSPDQQAERAVAQFRRPLGLRSADIDSVFAAIRTRIQADLGPLNKVVTNTHEADVVVILQREDRYLVRASIQDGELILSYPPD